MLFYWCRGCYTYLKICGEYAFLRGVELRHGPCTGLLIPWEHLPIWMRDARAAQYLKAHGEIPEDLRRDFKYEEIYSGRYSFPPI